MKPDDSREIEVPVDRATHRVKRRSTGVAVRLEDLERSARSANGGRGLPLRDWVSLAEAWRIAQALRDARGNRSAAARSLGIGRRTLYSKMERLGLSPIWVVSSRDGVE